MSKMIKNLKAYLRRAVTLAIPRLRHLAHLLLRGAQKLYVVLRLDRLTARGLATPFGQALLVRWHKVQSIYRKLTSPPPDPLMAAMMSMGKTIDIDEDPTELHGNRVFVLIASFFTIAILWATFTELDEVVRAEGTIVPPSSVQLVQNRLLGSGVTISAKVGQSVKKGDILFRLEDEDVVANFDDNEITLIAALATISRLTAEANGADELVFPNWLEGNTNAKDVVLAERGVFARRQRAIQSRLTSINRRVTNLKEKMDILRPLVEGGHEARLTLVEVRGEYNSALDEYEAVIHNFRAEAARELSEVQIRADQAGARESAFRAKVRNAEVRAPEDGTISAVHVKTVGAVVQAGTVLAEIVPDELQVLVKARIMSEDIASIFPGQAAQVALSAYDVSRYGNLEGSVQRIAPNTTQEENMPPYYETMISVPEAKLSKTDEEVDIVPGMTVVIDIIGKKRSVLDYIMTPLNRAKGVVFREN